MINNENNSLDDAAEPAGTDENLTEDFSAVEADLSETSVEDAVVIADQTSATEEEPAVGRKKRWPLVAAAILVPVLALAGTVTAAVHKTIELDYDGDVQHVTTWQGSVEGLLAQEGIALAEHDEIFPALDAKLEEGGVVVIRVAQEVTLDIDGKTVTIWTTADSAHELMTDLAASGRDGSIVASSRSIADGRDPLDLPLVADGDVRLAVDGGEKTRHFNGATTVKDALEAFGITLGETDEVTIAAGPAGDVLLKVTRIVFSERVETEEIPFETETRTSDSMYKDESRVVQSGEAGERTFTFRVKTVDGEEVEAKEISNEVTTSPISKIVEQGTKARPVVASSGSSGSGGSSGSSVGGDVWAALAQCESGGNPSIVSANGLYYGLYQFSLGTWQSVGGSGLPSDASASEQTMRAQMLQARSGWGQWPYCSSKLGLR